MMPLGARIPDGFAVTAVANCAALDGTDDWPKLNRLLDKLAKRDACLHIGGEEVLIDAVKRCQASLFTDRADQGFDHFKVSLSVAVMQMVRNDPASSDVMFSIDTESGHPDVVFTTGAWGLGSG